MKKERKEKITIDIINCPTLKEVCKKNKISEATLYRLRQESDFREILNKKRIEMYEGALNAAKVIIEMCSNYYDNAAILARIEELEERYRENQEWE